MNVGLYASWASVDTPWIVAEGIFSLKRYFYCHRNHLISWMPAMFGFQAHCASLKLPEFSFK
jgi:hypothetical protein